ncbi:MAG: hypothetical protein Q7R66_20990 [Undibacterium sp.]|uniref:hypothetical protein n=1 Tax=Undibacterium sp. TaxID=1914977 RepID=UPI0027173AF9|nr:hypothetical protein [Undibacterium sp.]MDO8654655.1 hypothetical protein [Undibacterium sp.]
MAKQEYGFNMNKLIATLIASTFVMASAFAQTPATTVKPAAAAAPTTTATATHSSNASSTKVTPKASASARTEAPGGGAGKVWINTKSNTYHCQGTEFYGKTKVGEYMTEADAKAKGAHANHGTACK